MKSRSIFVVPILLAVALTSTRLQANCDAPEAPELPDPQTAVLAEMVKAQKDMKKYIAAGEEYLGCAKSDRLHDIMVDEMKTKGDDFNARIREFKARKQQ